VKFLFTTSSCVCVQGVGHMPIVSLCPHTPQLENSLDVQQTNSMFSPIWCMIKSLPGHLFINAFLKTPFCIQAEMLQQMYSLNNGLGE
jgi:hypothetical protein